MNRDQMGKCRRRAWAMAFALWLVGAAAISYTHASIPDSGWAASLVYLMYFLEFWYIFALGELHRCFFVWLADDAG
jgi:hypothetical protein